MAQSRVEAGNRRGQLPNQPCFISLINVETMIPGTHPIRGIKRMCDEVLTSLSRQLDGIYAADGAPSIPPETLLKGKVLQALYTVRSDRQLCDRLKTDLLFRWFVDLPLDSEVFDASTYSKNQQRLLQHQVAELFFTAVVELARHHERPRRPRCVRTPRQRRGPRHNRRENKAGNSCRRSKINPTDRQNLKSSRFSAAC